MAATSTGQRTYNLGDVKPWVASAAFILGNMFGFTNIGGYREHGSVPNSDHPKGLALDFMTLKPTQANALIDYAIAHQSQFGITYIIYNRRIWQNGVWKAYDGPNPHTDHVHISFSATGATGGVTNTTLGFPNPFNPDNYPIIGQLNDFADKLTSADFWKRVGLYAMGALLLFGGVYFLVRRQTEELGGKAVQIAGKVL